MNSSSFSPDDSNFDPSAYASSHPENPSNDLAANKNKETNLIKELEGD